ncbi:unnamed protein product [Natator depressus]
MKGLGCPLPPAQHPQGGTALSGDPGGSDPGMAAVCRRAEEEAVPGWRDDAEGEFQPSAIHHLSGSMAGAQRWSPREPGGLQPESVLQGVMCDRSGSARRCRPTQHLPSLQDMRRAPGEKSKAPGWD